MKRRPGATSRQTALRTPGFDWRSRDDVVAAIKALRDEPLPEVTVVPEPGCPDGNVARAFHRAYGSHPVVVAAQTWANEEQRAERTFVVFRHPTYLHGHAARRWPAAGARSAPF